MSPITKSAIERVKDRHGKYVRETIGDVLFRALIVEQAFYVIAGQDDSVNAEIIRKIIGQVHDDVSELFA